MKLKIIRNFLMIVLIHLLLSTGHTSAREEYHDTFDNGLVNWIDETNSWSIINGSAVATGAYKSQPLIFKNFKEKSYVLETDFCSGKKDNYIEVQIYFYYENIGDYGRVYFADDNQGSDYKDRFGLHNKEIDFINTINHINFLDNRSLELYPEWSHAKIVRLNKMVYVYLNNNLLLTTEFNEPNPNGYIGYDVLTSSVSFDNFYLRPIEMKNASGYIDKLDINSTNPTTRLGLYTLRLEGVEKDGNAMFSLSKFGKKVDTTLAVEGTTATLNFENGDAGVEFKLVKAFSGGSGGIVQLEDIISASSDSIR
jgi:hypothetical protein